MVSLRGGEWFSRGNPGSRLELAWIAAPAKNAGAQ